MDEPDILVMISSLIGVTALIFVSKGDVFGQLLIVIFSILYGIVSIQAKYYGEAITYIGMSGLIAVFSIITWLKNPYEKHQVRVSALTPFKAIMIAVLTVAVTVMFYFILELLGTASLMVSTLSVATSFAASALALLRSPYYALIYCLNDIVLIVLWTIASIADSGSFPMILCFTMFLANDIYGFVNWRRMRRLQQKNKV
ncbi:MAG: nicotinamide mononucleotide transporter [Clostridia bacterium]|nr:nicotinamide mononucleotide transporter [Clostridia bacterium]